MSVCKYIYATEDEDNICLFCITYINLVDTDLICLVTAQISYYSK